MSGEPILIVDDNPTNLKLVRVILEIEGYDVRTATNSDEVFLLLKSFSPRIILMDLQLPGMDGLQLTRKLKSDPMFEKTVILAVTSYAMKGDEKKALAAGCDGYITKPIDTQALPNIIVSFLA